MRKQQYNIETCCGDYIKVVTVEIPEYADAYDHREDAMAVSGIDARYHAVPILD